MEAGDTRLADDFEDFCERWEWGVRALVQDANGLATAAGAGGRDGPRGGQVLGGHLQGGPQLPRRQPACDGGGGREAELGRHRHAGRDPDYSAESFEQAQVRRWGRPGRTPGRSLTEDGMGGLQNDLAMDAATGSRRRQREQARDDLFGPSPEERARNSSSRVRGVRADGARGLRSGPGRGLGRGQGRGRRRGDRRRDRLGCGPAGRRRLGLGRRLGAGEGRLGRERAGCRRSTRCNWARPRTRRSSSTAAWRSCAPRRVISPISRTAFTNVGNGLKGLDSAHLKGEAADAFREKVVDRAEEVVQGGRRVREGGQGAEGLRRDGGLGAEAGQGGHRPVQEGQEGLRRAQGEGRLVQRRRRHLQRQAGGRA